MSEPPLHVVTGAFGYSGRYIATRLLGAGVRVRTITNSTERGSPLQGRIEAHPFHFGLQSGRPTRWPGTNSVLCGGAAAAHHAALILIRFQDEANYGILAPWEDRGGWM